MDAVVFVGDVLFRESVGRTDLPGGSFDLLAQSIRERLFTRPDDVRCLTGHGPETTIGHERRHNPFVGVGAGNR
jgi:glyoxylase-like metal-dependent hydrolase (beta-lactamase superfamily II)